MQASHRKSDVVLSKFCIVIVQKPSTAFVSIRPPPAGLHPLPGCRFYPQTLYSPHFFRSAAHAWQRYYSRQNSLSFRRRIRATRRITPVASIIRLAI